MENEAGSLQTKTMRVPWMQKGRASGTQNNGVTSHAEQDEPITQDKADSAHTERGELPVLRKRVGLYTLKNKI